MHVAAQHETETVFVHIVGRTALIFRALLESELGLENDPDIDEIVATGNGSERARATLFFFSKSCLYGPSLTIEFELLESIVFDAYRRSAAGAHDLTEDE